MSDNNNKAKLAESAATPKHDSTSWGDITDADERREAAVRQIINLFKEFGAANYAANQVNLMEHSLQAAQLAMDHFRKGDQTIDDELVIGSLLHDFGKVVLMHRAKEEQQSPDAGKEEPVPNHEALGAEFLASLGFSERIQDICRGHVKAKRYLCWKDKDYYEKLHPMSKAKLEFQGGPMSDGEARAFEADPLFDDIMRMRTFDEQALKPGRSVMRLEDYAEMMKQVIKRDLFNPIKSFQNASIDSGRPLSALPDYNQAKNRLDKFDLGAQKPGVLSNRPGVDQILESKPQLRKNPTYYGRERTPSFATDRNNKAFPTMCALEHDKKFLKKQQEGKRAMQKLLFVAVICFIFMGVEAAGGVIANSLAILTDAAHMFSDVAGFMISFFSIYISQAKATTKYTLGYHRAEILGAYVSIFLIWGLLGWLNYEATVRIINRDTQPKIDANLMLITACIGFSCNVLNLFALNAECGGGEESEDDSDDEESKANTLGVSKLTKKSNFSRSVHSSLKSVYKPRQSIPLSKRSNKNDDAIAEEDDEERKAPAQSSDVNSIDEAGADKRVKLLQKHDKASKGDEFRGQQSSVEIQKRMGGDDEGNMNMKAAVVHIIGDMVQSIGVISAAIIIKCKPEWQIADPICTYLFSVLVLITTVPIFLECTAIIMEAAPDDVDTVELFNAIQRLRTVEELHDFHVWALGGGKNVLTCHVRSAFGDRCIKDINKICRGDYGIYHTTIQVESEKPEAQGISCVQFK